jgi:hypothetical protein
VFCAVNAQHHKGVFHRKRAHGASGKLHAQEPRAHFVEIQSHGKITKGSLGVELHANEIYAPEERVFARGMRLLAGVEFARIKGGCISCPLQHRCCLRDVLLGDDKIQVRARAE